MKKVIVFDLDGVIFDSIQLMPDLGMGPNGEETDEQISERMGEHAAQKVKVPVYDGMKELLEKFSKDHYLVINTSARKEHCIPLLERGGILNLFSFIAARELSSNKAQKFKLIADRFNVKQEEMIFITDTIGDIREAYMAKVATIAVSWGVHKHGDFKKEPKDSIVAIVDTPAELDQFLIGKEIML